MNHSTREKDLLIEIEKLKNKLNETDIEKLNFNNICGSLEDEISKKVT